METPESRSTLGANEFFLFTKTPTVLNGRVSIITAGVGSSIF